MSARERIVRNIVASRIGSEKRTLRETRVSQFAGYLLIFAGTFLNNRSLATRLILIATVALPVVPIAMDYFGPETSARWMLANAANEFDRGNVAQAQKLLEGAFEKSNEIISDKDFWRQFERIELSKEADTADLSPTKLWEEMIKRIDNPTVKANAAIEISTILSNRKKFEASAKLLQQYLPDREQRDPLANNQIAYMRALAGVDLEEALADVDKALESQQNESFLDTKAWVLHRLGRNEEALEVLDEAMKEIESTWLSNARVEKFFTRMNELEQALGQKQDPGPKDQEQVGAGEGVGDGEGIDPSVTTDASVATQQQQGDAQRSEEQVKGAGLVTLLSEFPVVDRGVTQLLDILTTMRYHRMRICESLKMDAEVAKEMRWLNAFSAKELDELY